MLDIGICGTDKEILGSRRPLVGNGRSPLDSQNRTQFAKHAHPAIACSSANDGVKTW
jgi:hypothetical protein